MCPIDPKSGRGQCWPGDELRNMGLDVHTKQTELGWEEKGLGYKLGAPTSALGLGPANVGGEPRRAYL